METAKPKMNLTRKIRFALGLAMVLMMAALWIAACAPPTSRPTGRFVKKDCLDCHTEFARQYLSMADVHTPVKEKNCEQCHLRHGVVPKLLLKQQGNQGCYSCHPQETIGMDKPVLHSAFQRESCVRCHNPHASTQKKLLQEPMRELCFQCHKQNSYTRKIVHEPLQKDSSCLTCHRPHGSDHPNVLTRSGQDLCLECHNSGSTAFQDAHGGYPVEEAACGSCHGPHSSDKPQLLRTTVHPGVDPKECTQCHVEPTSPEPFATNARGSELCYQCHDTAEMKGGEGVAHQPFAEGKCAACHQPHTSEEPELRSAAGNNLCYSCHAGLQSRVEKPHGAVTGEKGCLSCHGNHSAGHENLLLNREQPLCFSCHPDSKSAMAEPVSHTPFEEGNCSGCHDPHGSNYPAMINNRMDVVCYACHADAEVKFTKSSTHEPVSTGQCNACHRSHGAAKAGLLGTDAKDPELCKSCHEALMQPSAKNVEHPPFTEGRCLECHDVHGSNIPGMLARKQGFLCSGCHGTDLKQKSGKIASRHAPSVDGQCSACHQPHKAGLESLLLAESPDLCLACHSELRVVTGQKSSGAAGAEPSEGGDGTTEEPEEKMYVHAPGEIEKCGTCHRPHQSDQVSLMNVPIQPLCAQCHDYGTEEFGRAHLQIDAARMDCRNCHTPHVARTKSLFKNVLHPPFAKRECKDCHLVDNP